MSKKSRKKDPTKDVRESTHKKHDGAHAAEEEPGPSKWKVAHMTLVANKTGRSTLSPEKRALLDRILELRPTQRRRVFALSRLHEKARNEQEAREISEALAEILFRDPESLAATPINNERSKDGGKTLGEHRAFVAGQIKKQRQRLKMSQEELARKAGIPQSHVCRLETGKHAPTYLTIEKLAKAMKVKPSQLDPGVNDED
jgi:ribosome-binding protein aMBF1 (putative translation factor)